MDPPPPRPSKCIEFSDVVDTRVCGRASCQRFIGDCTEDEKKLWEPVNNSRNMGGTSYRWICGQCSAFYDKRPSTQHSREAILSPVSITDVLLRSCYKPCCRSRVIQHQQPCGGRPKRQRYVHGQNLFHNQRLIRCISRSYIRSSNRATCPCSACTINWIVFSNR